MSNLKFIRAMRYQNICADCGTVIPEGSPGFWNGERDRDKTKNYCENCGKRLNEQGTPQSVKASPLSGQSGVMPDTAKPTHPEPAGESPMSPTEVAEAPAEFSVETNMLEAREFIKDLYKKELKAGTIKEPELIELIAEKAREQWQLWSQKRKELVWRDV